MFSTHILGGAKFCDADASRLVTAANRAIAPAAGRVGARRGSGPWRRRFAVARRSPLPCAGRGVGSSPPPARLRASATAARLLGVGARPRRTPPPPLAPSAYIPPSPSPLLPRVEHVILPADARAAGPACEVLARLVPGSPRVDETTIRELVALGAVWHAPRPPPRARSRASPARSDPAASATRTSTSPRARTAASTSTPSASPRRSRRRGDPPSSPAARRSSSSTNPPA